MSLVFGDFRRYRKTLLHSVKPDPLFGFQITQAKEGVALNLATQTDRVDYRILELTQGETEFIYSLFFLCSTSHTKFFSILFCSVAGLVSQADGRLWVAWLLVTETVFIAAATRPPRALASSWDWTVQARRGLMMKNGWVRRSWNSFKINFTNIH